MKMKNSRKQHFDRLASGIWPSGLLSAPVDTINYRAGWPGKEFSEIILEGGKEGKEMNRKKKTRTSKDVGELRLQQSIL